MGVFDYLKCDYPLPDGDNALEFQTKDTPGQWLDRFTITAEGRLVHHQYDTEEVPREERPHPNDAGFLGLFGSSRKVPGSDRVVGVDFDGDIHFYDCEVNGMGKNADYRATFRKGKLREMCKLVNDAWEPIPTPKGRE